MAKCGKWVVFGSKINTFELYSKSGYLIFLKLYLMTNIKKWFKMTAMDF